MAVRKTLDSDLLYPDMKSRFQLSLSFLLVLLSSWSIGRADTNLGNLDRVFGSSGESYPERFQAIKALTNGELDHRKEDVIRFLQEVDSEDSLSDSEHAAVKNNLIDLVTGDPVYTADLPQMFLKILRDPEQNKIWKDYVVQKIPRIYEDCDSNEQQDLLAEIRNFTRERKGVICGTALLALLRISRIDDQVNTSQLGKLSLQIALDEGYETGSRLTALSVANGCDASPVRVVARSFLNGSGPIVLKAQALSILSEETTPEDMELIESYLDHSDYRLRNAARSAKKKIESLHSPASSSVVDF